jgi:hypothetical protein
MSRIAMLRIPEDGCPDIVIPAGSTCGPWGDRPQGRCAANFVPNQTQQASLPVDKSACLVGACCQELLPLDQFGQLPARVEHARLDGGLGDPDDLGNLLDRLVVIVDEVDDFAVLR